MRRTERERKRLAIANALLNAQRLLQLVDNPLIEHESVLQHARQQYGDKIMAEPLALSDLVTASARSVLTQISAVDRLKREAAVLETILNGGSVQAAALQLGRSREHITNTAWRTVTTWVLEEFERTPRLATIARPRPVPKLTRSEG